MGEVATIVGGSTPRTDRDEYFGGDIPWITPADLSGYKEKTISRGARNITKAGYENSGVRLMPANTILFSSRAPIGYVAIAANPVTTNQGFKSFVLKDSLLPDFVYYYLQRAREFATALASGTTFLEISGKNAARLPIPVPPLEDQRKIVAEIEKQFTRLDAGVAALRRVQANLKRYRAVVLKAACEGLLVPTEAELAKAENRTFEAAAELLSRILMRRKELFAQNKANRGSTEYREPSPIAPGAAPVVPNGWALASSEFVCSSVRDGTHDTPAYVHNGVPLITSKNLLPHGLDFENVKFVTRADHIEISKRSGVQRGDVLFAMIGTIGNPVVVDTDREFSIKNVGLFKQNPDFILPRYLRYWFMSPTFSRWLKPKQRGTTQKFVPLGLLRALVVPLPPLAEQTRIVAEVDRRLSIIDELESVVATDLQRASRLRQSILQRAFSGKLLPRV
jgi:type I restriction enzyme S subunit